MRFRLAAALVLLPVAIAHADDIAATSRVDAVTVFPAGAEVTRVAKLKLDKGEHVVTFADIPAEALPGSIRVEGKATGRLDIGSVDSRRLFVSSAESRAAQSERKKIEDEIEALRDERSLYEGQIEAGKTQEALLKNLAQLPLAKPGDNAAAPREDWRQLLGLIGSSMGEVQKTSQDAALKIRETDRKIEDLDKKLAALAPAEEERTEVKVFVSAAAPLEADMTVRYQVQSASWSPLYDARLSTGSKTVAPKLTLTRRAAITQQTGETWNDVALSLSTTRPTAGTAAPELRTVSVDFEPERKPRPMAGAPAPIARSAPAGEAAAQAPAPVDAIADQDERRDRAKVAYEAQQRSAEVVTAPFQAIFGVPGRVSIANTGEAKRVQLQEDAIEPTLAVRTVPKQDAKAYLYAKLALPKGSPVLAGPVSLFRDGTFVGAGRLPLLVAAEDHELGFGVDDLVRVRHAIAEEKRGETGLISSSRTDQRDFRITVKNMHERAVQLTVVDQIPVSKNNEITVELTGRTAPTKRDVDDKRGVLVWEAKLEPDEERVIEFGYRVTWPAAKAIEYGR